MSSSSSANTYFSYSSGMRFSTVAVLAMSALYGCGGGGGDSPGEPVTQVPEERPITLPITEMPTSSHSGFKQEAFVRLNEARIAAGVSAVKQNAQLDAAAQAHAEYLAGNYVTGHYEDSAKPLFTGYGHTDRAIAQGYKNFVRSEVITYFYATATGTAHADIHLNSVYHLAAALDPAANELGIGVAETSVPGRYIPSSFTFGTTDQRVLPVEAVWVWPADGTSLVPRGFIPASENPNPLPDIARDQTVVVGAPIMFCGSRDNYAHLEITHLNFIEVGEETPRKMRVLHHSAVKVPLQEGFEAREDLHLVEQRNSHCIFIIPLEELAANRTYAVNVEALQGNYKLNKRWSFTTTQ